MNIIDCIVSPFSIAFKHKSLLKGFVSREVKKRFVGTMGGFIWTFLSPLATIVAYSFVFSLVLRMAVSAQETGTDSFLIFFLTGYFPWLMFSDSVSKSVFVLLNDSSLITKVVFPTELLPISTVIATFIVNGTGYFIVLIYLLFKGFFHIYWIFIPLLMIMNAIFALGLSFFLSALNLFFRDTSEVLNIFMMLWFFSTPIIYPASMVPDGIKTILMLNPMSFFIENFRSIVLLHQIDALSLIFMSVFSVISFVFGSWFFLKSRPAFGDVL
ncbi:MAG: ABC transporter permease [Desulfamplus sp.]|nr:ABC transporter permease [Desulfamplus sp.]